VVEHMPRMPKILDSIPSTAILFFKKEFPEEAKDIGKQSTE
jgi:hypothetical protein